MAEGGRSSSKFQNQAFSDDAEDSSSTGTGNDGKLLDCTGLTETRPNQNESSKGLSSTFRDQNVWWEHNPKKSKEICVKKFAEKLNAFTRKSIENVDVTDELHPQIKSDVDLFCQEYVPLDGLSAQSQSRTGRTVTLKKYVKKVHSGRTRPCVIIGRPGSGKTVFLKRLAEKNFPHNRRHDDEFWKKVLRLFRRGINVYDVTLYLDIKDFENLDHVTPAQTIFNPMVTGLTAEEAQHGLYAILKKKIRVMIVFDGLDQTGWLPDASTTVGHWTETTTASIFGNILAGHLLPEVPIAISSNEHSMAHLPPEMQPTFVASLCGFKEADAKTLYTRITGHGADESWEKLRTTNPRLFRMCLDPLFLVYYVITRKRDPSNPPDCTSDVMARIVQSLAESRDKTVPGDSVQIVNKLKRMAFEGTKKQRVVFTNDDLKQFEIKYCDIIKMKITKSDILDQKIFQGTSRKFHLCHQALQDMLAALHVAGMSFEHFREFHELYEGNWSVVRSFTCAVLKNERVLDRISDRILSRDGLKEKRDWLIAKLEACLHQTTSPAETLDIFVALREAAAFDILTRYTKHLDFSNSPLTSAMMNILCCELRFAGEVKTLLLRNCGVDDELLEILVKSATGHVIKISVLDLRGNVEWTNKSIWGKIFENLIIETCMIEIPCHGQNEDNAALLLDVVKAAHRKVGSLHVGDLKKIQLRIKQIEKLAKYDITLQVTNIRLAIDERLVDEEWKKIGTVLRLLVNVPSWQLDYFYLPNLKFFAEGYGNVKFRRFTSWSSYQLYIRLSDSESSTANDKLADVELVHKHLPNQPFGVGQLIRECQFEELVFYWPFRELDVPAFASGLKGYKIKLLAVKGFSSAKLLEIVRQCEVERVYLDTRPSENTLNELKRHTDIIGLSEDQWSLRFRGGS